MQMDKIISKAGVLVEALPYIQQFNRKVILVKFGGSAMDDPSLIQGILRDIAFMAAAGMRPVIVHGGGKAINAELQNLAIEPRFINGLRYTCAQTIKVVDRVLHEIINHDLVQFLRQHCDTDAVPVSGKNILRCERITTTDKASGEELDLGFVGKVVNVDTPQLDWILQRHQIPVITPLACDQNGQVFNINADMAACVIATQMRVCKLVFLSDVPGVLEDPANPSSLLSTIRNQDITELERLGTISGGMLPKLYSAAEAIRAGVEKVHLIDGHLRHALLLEIFTDQGIGTQIV